MSTHCKWQGGRCSCWCGTAAGEGSMEITRWMQGRHVVMIGPMVLGMLHDTVACPRAAAVQSSSAECGWMRASPSACTTSRRGWLRWAERRAITIPLDWAWLLHSVVCVIRECCMSTAVGLSVSWFKRIWRRSASSCQVGSVVAARCCKSTVSSMQAG